MKWKIPPKIKIYEALGTIGDGRLAETDDGAKVDSSKGDKTYTVIYDDETKAVMTNDNGSFWQGYLGYPAIAYLMIQGVLVYNDKAAKALSGINWNEINKKFKRKYEKSEEYALEWAEKNGFDRGEMIKEVDSVMQQIERMGFEKLGKRMRPPSKK